MNRMKASKIRSYCASSVDELLELELPTSDAVIIADVSTIRRFAHSFPMQLHDGERSLPVIYLTQYDTERMRDEARQVGAAGYFRKPIDEQALIDAITFAVQ